MKLFYSPGACSLGIHALLEEIGAPFDPVLTNLREGAQFKPEFVSVNPKSKVPTLQRDDGSVITEFPAIAYWLGRTFPEKNLLPADLEGQVRALEAMDFVVATMHMQGFSRIFRPTNFAPSEADSEAVKARGREIFERGLAVLDKSLAGKEFIAGKLSIADFALFYVEFWGAARLGLALPANVDAHYKRMLALPSVQRALQREGLSVAA